MSVIGEFDTGRQFGSVSLKTFLQCVSGSVPAVRICQGQPLPLYISPFLFFLSFRMDLPLINKDMLESFLSLPGVMLQ